jgi:ribosomal protein L24
VEEFAISPGDRVNIEAGDERGSWGVVRLVDQDGLYHVAQADGNDVRVYERDEITK